MADLQRTETEPTSDGVAIATMADPESRTRELGRVWGAIVSGVAIALSLFQVYTAAFGEMIPQVQRGTHVGLVLAIVFLLYSARKGFAGHSPSPLDVLLALGGLAIGFYQVFFAEHIVTMAGDYNNVDLAMAGLALVLVLEATRRVIGWPLVGVALASMAYAFLGPYLPGGLSHSGFSLTRIASQSYLTTEGIMGIPIGVSSTFVFMFILFGAFLQKSGLGKFFIDLAMALTGTMTGGPAKIAVVSSGLMGTISGSSTANVVTTGSFTIPLMKSIGYKPHFAGAVEATASTGGQLMPPIMGAAAFIMAEFTNVPYIQIAIAAALPALLYYLCVGMSTHFEAKRYGLGGLPREQLPRAGTVLKNAGFLVLPIGAIVWLLLSGFTPVKAALYAIGLAIIVSWMGRATRMGIKEILAALDAGARTAAVVAVACAAAGVTVGMVTLTGAGLKLGYGIVELAHGLLLPTLFFTMIASLVLGMGVPTTANYIITATIAAPAIVQLGVPLLAAHMFAFYFGIVADITPPVALAAYAASGLAKSNPMQTGLTATRLGISAFLIPYIFVTNPALLLLDTMPLEGLWVAVSSITGVVGLSAAVIGFWRTELTLWERAILMAGALGLMTPGLLTDILGLLALVLVWFTQERRLRAKRQALSAQP